MATDSNNTTKPPMFDGEDFDYWKDRLESFILGHDPDLWDIVLDGYTHLVDDEGKKIDRKDMDAQQRREFKNHHRARNIMLNAISKIEYEKISNRDTAHSIF